MTILPEELEGKFRRKIDHDRGRERLRPYLPAWSGENPCTRTNRHAERPKTIAGPGSEPDTPRRPKPAALFPREQSAPDHLGIYRSGRPRDRPTEHKPVEQD